MRFDLTDISIGAFLLALAIVPGLGWYLTSDPTWLFGYLLLLLLGLAG